MTDPRQSIRDQALSLGFDAVGFAEASLGAEARAHLGDYLALGYHGDMGCLLNMAGKLKRLRSENGAKPVKVRHVAEVLADATDTPPIGEAK